MNGARRGRTTAFRSATGEVLPGSIAEVGYIELGHVPQWVMIRGASVDNPPLILLHGGPGFSEAPLFRYFNAALERSFTVVYWDQRGTGKSFNRRIPRSSMTVEQFLADLDELVQVVCARLGQARVMIFGHSWGSALGALYASRFPQRVAAYAGSGQIGDWAAGESESYAYALAEAERRGQQRALRDLRAIGAPPYGRSSLIEQRTWLRRFDGQMNARTLATMARIFVRGPEFSVLDLPRSLRGFRFSLDAMWAEVSRLNLLESAPVLQAPVFFLLGRKDHWVPPQCSLAYYEQLEAPSKQLVWFERSGHEPFVDEPDKFNGTLVELVRPLLAR